MDALLSPTMPTSQYNILENNDDNKIIFYFPMFAMYWRYISLH